MIRFASLGSGSKGNALLVQSGRTRLLVDCGFGPRELVRRLARLGVVPEQLDAVLVTHEHSDHIAGLAALVRRVACPVHVTRGTCAALGARAPAAESVRTIRAGETFTIGDLSVAPYAVPHDAREPVQYVLSTSRLRLGVLTDAGHVTAAMQAMLAGCDALVLEFNHDLELLEAGPYPRFLKTRIGGPQGHLDNEAAATLLERTDSARLQHVCAAHLSEQNNCRERVASRLARALSPTRATSGIASQRDGTPWCEIV